MDKYNNFMQQIPDQIKQNVETHICSDMVLFKPQLFVAGITIHSVDYHIIVCSETPPDTYVNGKLQSFDSGKILVINPGDTWLCPRGHSTKQYLSLLIKPYMIDKVAKEMGFYDKIRFLKLQNQYSNQLMQTIQNFEGETRNHHKSALMLDCLVIQIAVLLLREFKTNIRQQPALLPDNEAPIALAIEYIQEYFNANITIEDICGEINMSPFHFIRTFKQITGLSPHQYLLKVRISRAQDLLRKRHHSVAEAATLCGFINISHFSSKFKEITGYSPSSYKKIYS
ncbi:MAG: AraC family transcriptional regulator [Syntrophomonas sp.]